ncbi:MAG TPA: hypothetical protein VHZ33_05785 [Trebonia sp.]|nr:hypothetical protein [Trebonia sp.]
MRAMTRAADRMLNALVPKITADAGCTQKTWTVNCYCREVGNEFYNQYAQTCTTAPTCATYCTSCQVVGVC